MHFRESVVFSAVTAETGFPVCQEYPCCAVPFSGKGIWTQNESCTPFPHPDIPATFPWNLKAWSLRISDRLQDLRLRGTLQSTPSDRPPTARDSYEDCRIDNTLSVTPYILPRVQSTSSLICHRALTYKRPLTFVKGRFAGLIDDPDYSSTCRIMHLRYLVSTDWGRMGWSLA